MKIFLLPGANPDTAVWLQTLARKLQLLNTSVQSHQYSFWSQQDVEKSLTHEIGLLPDDALDLASSIF